MPRNAVGHRNMSKRTDEPTRRGYPGFVLLEQVGSLSVFVKLYPTWRVVCTAFFRVSGHRSQRSIPGDRKVTNRFRAQWAAEADVAVRTVIDTASLAGTNPFTQIRQTLSS